MPNAIDIDASGRVVAPEGKTREYKRDLSSTAKPLRTIVAFANSAGGQVIIGVEDNGTVVGVADPLAEEERLASLIADSITPRIMPGIDLVTVGDKTLLVVDVPLSTQRPHYLTSTGQAEGTYIRLGSTNRKADSTLIADLERGARGIRYEDLPEHQATLADLDLTLVPPFDGQAVTQTDLVPLGLAVREGTTLVPTKAGLLAACPYPDRFITSAWVQLGRIRGVNRTNITDRLEYHGPLLSAADKAMEFLRKHAFFSAKFGKVQLEDVWSIPVKALREVIVNALVHANYAEPGTPIRVAFYDEQIEVEGPGLLVAGMTIESMRNASRLRNPSLARIFRAAGQMENFGTGVRRVYEQMAEAGLPEPKIEEIVDRVRFTVYLRSHANTPDLSATSEHQDEAPRHQDEAPRHQDEAPRHQDEALRHQADDLSESAVVILHRTANEPASRAELMEALGIANQTRAFRRHIEPLLTLGLLERTLPDKPTSGDQRYRITNLGQSILIFRGETQ